MNIINFSMPEVGNFLVSFIAWLIQSSGSIALGIVLFTLALKLITLPFDYFSRASMRKNNVKMEKMRPELEKLQEQYKDNKELYSQKMMALYKKNGYSMWGSCLPTILTLVIFIVAINAFTSYSQYQNQKYFYDMSSSYNNVVYAGLEIDNEYITLNDGRLSLNKQKIYDELKEENQKTISAENREGQSFEIYLEKKENPDNQSIYIWTNPGYMKVSFSIEIKDEQVYIKDNDSGQLIEGKVAEYSGREELSLANEFNNNLMIKGADGKNVKFSDANLSEADFLKDIQRQNSADTFHRENQPFLWIKNIWVTDSAMAHPVESQWGVNSQSGCSGEKSGFRGNYNYVGYDITQAQYDELIFKLEEEKTVANGYFILVALTAASSFLTQWVMKKTQKAQMELQTVDGQGAQTQKMMMWMMPIMMAIFAFMYTAAFSIYIITSTALSLGLTFLINFIVDKQIAREEKSSNARGGEKIRGRVYQPKAEEVKKQKEEPKKPAKDDKFAHESGGDFLTGPKKSKNIKIKK